MHVTDRRAARTAARVLVVPAALAALAVAAPQAAAHTELETGSPAKGASLAGLPPKVTLTFSDEVTQEYAKVAVTGADGKSASQGEPQVDGKSVALALDTGAPAGRYTVGYRVVSADGHPVSGSYTFTVKGAKEPTNPAPAVTAKDAAPPAAPAPEANQATEDSSSATAPVVAGAAGAVAVAAAAGIHAARRRKRAGHGG